MKLSLAIHERRGSALVVVLILCGITLTIMLSALKWSSTNTTLAQRNNEYFRTVAVAEAATEKVMSSIVADYKKGGEALVLSKNYSGMIPTSTENSKFSKYEFGNGYGQRNKTYIQNASPTEYKLLSAQYRGLRGLATPFRILSNARQLDSMFNIPVAVQQEFELTTIPLFQFAIFYNVDLEIAPAPVMTITGPVHCNEDIYLAPGNTLTFMDDVTCAGDIIYGRKDTSLPPGTGAIGFGGKHTGGTSSLNLPIGTNNTPAAVHQVVEVPPGTELPDSELGKERFYNKAEMIIAVSNTTITVTSGRFNNFATVIPRATFYGPSNANSGFLSTNQFFSKRENKTVKTLDIDIAKLVRWNLTNTLLKPVLTNTLTAGNVTILYVVDYRTQTLLTESGVRVVNGTNLPPKGLTVATSSPLYVWGDYNVTTAALGTTNTTLTKPAALVGDSISVLSANWNDTNAGAALGVRMASDTTVNAAFLAGIVETTNSAYSGGVENFPRFLEKWTNRKFTYNGSMVVMYSSTLATGAWGGANVGIYEPPIRMWSFDGNFRDFAKLPPGTPMARGVVRNKWVSVRPNMTVVGP